MRETTVAPSRRGFLKSLVGVLGVAAFGRTLAGCADHFVGYGDELVANRDGMTVWELTEMRLGRIGWTPQRGGDQNGGMVVVQIGDGPRDVEYVFAVDRTRIGTDFPEAGDAQAANNFRLRTGQRVQWYFR